MIYIKSVKMGGTHIHNIHHLYDVLCVQLYYTTCDPFDVTHIEGSLPSGPAFSAGL